MDAAVRAVRQHLSFQELNKLFKLLKLLDIPPSAPLYLIDKFLDKYWSVFVCDETVRQRYRSRKP